MRQRVLAESDVFWVVSDILLLLGLLFELGQEFSSPQGSNPGASAPLPPDGFARMIEGKGWSRRPADGASRNTSNRSRSGPRRSPLQPKHSQEPCMYPNGIAYQSPGLQRSATPGGASPLDPTPKGLCPTAPGGKGPLPPP